MSLLVILVILFMTLTIFGKLFNLIKWFVMVGLIIVIATPFVISSSFTSPKIIENLSENRVIITQDKEINTFKIKPDFGDKNLFQMTLEDFKEGPESVTITYNPDNLEKIPSEIKNILDSVIKNKEDSL